MSRSLTRLWCVYDECRRGEVCVLAVGVSAGGADARAARVGLARPVTGFSQLELPAPRVVQVVEHSSNTFWCGRSGMHQARWRSARLGKNET